jgi:N-acetylglutamate synthase-like GNAT family acetyltransferase
MEREPAPLHADYATLIAQGVVFVLVDDVDKAEDVDEGAIGGIVVMMSREQAMFVENVAVDPRLQGQGLGKKLMAFVEEQAREAQLREIYLYTNELMTENLHFYQRLGFEEAGRGMQDGYRRVFLRKVLA